VGVSGSLLVAIVAGFITLVGAVSYDGWPQAGPGAGGTRPGSDFVVQLPKGGNGSISGHSGRGRSVVTVTSNPRSAHGPEARDAGHRAGSEGGSTTHPAHPIHPTVPIHPTHPIHPTDPIHPTHPIHPPHPAHPTPVTSRPAETNPGHGGTPPGHADGGHAKGSAGEDSQDRQGAGMSRGRGHAFGHSRGPGRAHGTGDGSD